MYDIRCMLFCQPFYVMMSNFTFIHRIQCITYKFITHKHSYPHPDQSKIYSTDIKQTKTPNIILYVYDINGMDKDMNRNGNRNSKNHAQKRTVCQTSKFAHGKVNT